MSLLKTLGLGIYYRLRRMKKALKNWRRFGIVIFGSLFIASSLVIPSAVAQDFRVEVYHNGSRISGLIVDANSTNQFNARAFVGTQEVTNSTQFIWARNAAYDPSDLGTVSGTGLFSAGSTADFYSGAINVRGSYDGYSDTDTISITINSTTPPPSDDVLNRVEIYDAQGNRISGFITEIGRLKQLYGRAYDTEGDDITSVTSFTWDISSAYNSYNVGAITGSGAFTAGQTPDFYTGAIRLTGSYNGNSDLDTASVTINGTTPPPPPPVVCSYIDISTSNPNLYVGDTANVYLDARDSQSGHLDYTDLQWSWNLGWFDVYGANHLYHATEVGTGTLTARCPGNPSVSDSITFNVQDIWIQQEYLVGVNGWADTYNLYGYNNTSLSSYAWSNLRSPLPGTTYYWEKLNGVGYLSGNIYSQNGARFNSNNVNGSATLQVTASWGGASVTDTVVVYTHDNIIPPPPPPREYLMGVNGWPATSQLDIYGSTSLSTYAWSNLRNPLPGATYYWEKLNGVGYLSGNVHNQYGVRFNAGNIVGSANIRVTAYWGGSSTIDTFTVYVSTTPPPPPPPPPPVPDPIYTSFVGIVEGGGTACDNDIIQYTIKLGNFGQNLISGVRLKMDIPTYTSFLSASSAVDHPRLEDGVIVWDAGTLYTNDIETLIVRVMLNDNIPAVGIQGNAYVAYDQLGGNFNIKSNIIYTCGGTGGPTEPLTPTGVDWQILALLAMISLGLTTLTYGYLRSRANQMDTYS